MSDVTPADLAKFVHPVPIGARFPMHVEFMEFRESGDYFRGPFNFPDATAIQQPDDPKRWTAEPILTPEQQRLEDEYAAACEAIYAAERAVAKARKEAEALRPRAESLYRELQRAGRR